MTDFFVQEIRSEIAEKYAQNHVASYCGLPPARLSRGLNGEIEFSSSEKDMIISTLAAMRSLQRSVQPPVPIDWSKVAELRALIVSERKKIQQAYIHDAFLVEFDDGSLFEQIDDGKVARTWNKDDHAALLKTCESAKAVCEILMGMGFRVRVAPTRVLVPESRLIEKIADLGFTLVAQ